MVKCYSHFDQFGKCHQLPRGVSQRNKVGLENTERMKDVSAAVHLLPQLSHCH